MVQTLHKTSFPRGHSRNGYVRNAATISDSAYEAAQRKTFEIDLD